MDVGPGLHDSNVVYFILSKVPEFTTRQFPHRRVATDWAP